MFINRSTLYIPAASVYIKMAVVYTPAMSVYIKTPVVYLPTTSVCINAGVLYQPATSVYINPGSMGNNVPRPGPRLYRLLLLFHRAVKMTCRLPWLVVTKTGMAPELREG